MKKVFITILIALLSTNALAISIPKGSSFDKRVQSINFNQKDVIKINLSEGFVSSIIFDEKETILDVMTGFSNGYEIKENLNVLYLKPKSVFVNKSEIYPTGEYWNTNLLVTTTSRMYAFDLNIVPANNPNITYRININYPQQQVQVKNELVEKQKEIIKQQNLSNELLTFKSPRNWDYLMKVGKNSTTIKPVFTYDDGQFTYLGFEKNSSFPSVFLYEDGKETLLNTHVKYDGNYQILVIQRLSKVFVLRSGERVIGIYNQGFNQNPISQKYQTTSSDKIDRVTK